MDSDKQCPSCGAAQTFQQLSCTNCQHVFASQWSDASESRMYQNAQSSAGAQAGSVTGDGNKSVKGIYSPFASLFLAVVFHFVITGSGLMYLGQVGKGILMLGMTIVFFYAFWPLAFVIWILSFIDTIIIANRLGARQVVDKWQFF